MTQYFDNASTMYSINDLNANFTTLKNEIQRHEILFGIFNLARYLTERRYWVRA